MTKQKALLIPTFDGVTKDNITMQLTEIDIPKPAEGEVLVHVTLRPVNPTGKRSPLTVAALQSDAELWLAALSLKTLGEAVRRHAT